MNFLDRRDELALLDAHYRRPGASLFVLYGRRRIGKTALLERWLAKKPRAAYHVGTRSTVIEELRRLSRTLARAWKLPLLEAQPLGSINALLALLRSVERRSVLVLDEFPFLAESDPALPGLLQAAWDVGLSRAPLKLVLCGSSVSVMEETLMSPRSPLFGRRTGQLALGALPAADVATAFPGSSISQIELLATFGGIPGYLARLDPRLDLRANLRAHVLARGEPLYEEIPFLLREELREPRVYHAILATIAAGGRRFGEIASKVGLDRANLSRYLATLIELRLVARDVPVTEPRPEKSRNGLYRVCDPFVATWFALVHPHRDALERGRLDLVADDVEATLRRQLPLAVEPVLRELCVAGPLRHLVPFQPACSGRYWSPTAEVDIVLLDAARRRALLAEVKWGDRPVSPAVGTALRAKAAREPALAGMDCSFAVISRRGFGRGVGAPGVHHVDVRRLALSP